jgi:carbon monoxide dehydrogenase subunit G
VAPAIGAAGPIETRVERDGSALQVRSTIEASAPALTCYATLADLDHLAEFVPGLKSSRVVSPPDSPIELHQVGEARAGPFGVTLDVTLAVRLEPPHRIEFRRVAGNLAQMQGSWAVSGDDQGCRIEYRATMQPDFWVPPLLGPMLMRREVDAQMAGVLAEISRRALRTPPMAEGSTR